MVKAYIQSIVIQRTVESILTDLEREKVDISYGVRQHDWGCDNELYVNKKYENLEVSFRQVDQFLL